MYWCARISKPVGTPDIAILHAFVSLYMWVCAEALTHVQAQHVIRWFNCVSEYARVYWRAFIFADYLKSKSFYLSERMELSNKALSFNAISASNLRFVYVSYIGVSFDQSLERNLFLSHFFLLCGKTKILNWLDLKQKFVPN